MAAYSRKPLTELTDVLHWAVEAGLADVQLPWEQVVRGGGPEAARDRVHQAGLEVIGMDAPAWDALDDETFQEQTTDLARWTQAAQRIGAGQITVRAGPRDPANFAYLVDACKRLTRLAKPVGLGVSIRNVCNSSVEQLDDLHRLFREVGDDTLTLDLDMAEFQAAVVNPFDAVVSFAKRTARVRVCAVNLEATLAALRRDGFAGPILVAMEDGVGWWSAALRGAGLG